MSRLSLVTLVVDNYDEAIAFFVDAVGFALVTDEPSVADDGSPKRWVVVSPGEGGSALLLAQATSERQAARVGDQTGGRVGFFLEVDDFDRQYRHMVAAGVEFCEAPRHEPYGTVAVWQDIAGNRWDLLGPPAP